MNDHLTIILVAIAAIVILESVALIQGVDGIMFGSAIGGITFAIGYMFKAHKVNVCGRNDNPKRKD